MLILGLQNGRQNQHTIDELLAILKKAEKTLPMGELVDPKKLAPLVTYLLSFSSGVITGAIINYDQQIVGAVPE